ncbi:hypothetical protein [Amycolatopsis magusensis]
MPASVRSWTRTTIRRLFQEQDGSILLDPESYRICSTAAGSMSMV